MNLANRDQSRQQYERRRRAAAVAKTSLAEQQTRNEEAARVALSKYASRRAALAEGARATADAVFERAPRLAIEPYAAAVRLLTKTSTRPVGDWCPRGKGRDTLFRSLAEHLLAKFPVPAVLWDGFFDASASGFAPLVANVAGGGSLFAFVTDTGFPIKLTRRMCHELLSTPSCGSLLRAIRRVQVKFAGGDDRLFRAWLGTQVAQSVGTEDDEIFWSRVLSWLARDGTLDPAELSPLVDYLGDRRRQDAAFSVSGRSLAAVTRAMNEWHRGLAREKVVRDELLPPSGYAAIVVDRSGHLGRRVWRVREVTSTRELADEGLRMNHCVYSYLGSIQKGFTSIWMMTLEDGSGPTGSWAMLTVEVRRDLRRIVQARGRFNRPATSEELGILHAWATRNALDISLFT
jgi:PcfJ-like protein